MNSFGGFTHAHFCFFAKSSDEHDDHTKEAIRHTLNSVVSDLKKHVPNDWEPYGPRITDLNAWATLWPPNGSERPHLSIAVSVEGLQVFANIEKQPAYKQFLKRWESDPSGLLSVLRRHG